MIKVENIETWGFEHAIRGMRNPMNSWDKSDSRIYNNEAYVIGDNDLDLMQRLYKAGHPHRKYLRQIMVSMDITAPLYWWKEFDTYKVGTTANSCSTMHKIHSKEFELEDFSHEHLISNEPVPCKIVSPKQCLEVQIQVLNTYREMYLKYKDKKYWWQMIQLLPSSYNQKRTVTFTYENVFNMLQYRQNHKLDEWNVFCEILKDLPYIKEIGGIE
jgi:hypothetical protein